MSTRKNVKKINKVLSLPFYLFYVNLTLTSYNNKFN